MTSVQAGAPCVYVHEYALPVTPVVAYGPLPAKYCKGLYQQVPFGTSLYTTQKPSTINTNVRYYSRTTSYPLPLNTSPCTSATPFAAVPNQNSQNIQNERVRAQLRGYWLLNPPINPAASCFRDVTAYPPRGIATRVMGGAGKVAVNPCVPAVQGGGGSDRQNFNRSAADWAATRALGRRPI